jgi:hypothetical protein
LLNAFVGWYQEKAAGDVVAKLRADIALKSEVVRNGKEVTVEAREVVPGDIIIVEVSFTFFQHRMDTPDICSVPFFSRMVSPFPLMAELSLITLIVVVSSPKRCSSALGLKRKSSSLRRVVKAERMEKMVMASTEAMPSLLPISLPSLVNL